MKERTLMDATLVRPKCVVRTVSAGRSRHPMLTGDYMADYVRALTVPGYKVHLGVDAGTAGSC